MSDTPAHSADPTDAPPGGALVPARGEPALPAEHAESPRWLRAPPIDIFDSPAGLVLRADLPGVSGESLELQVQDSKLTLFGRVQSQLPDDSRLVHQEYHVGDFLRSFILSDDFDHDRITARLTDGVLELVLPRSERATPRKIQVKTD
jgi:HSP20 family protein